jgi:TolB-like protein/DNA-binding winged helix-turn-helix (wHTH) protein
MATDSGSERTVRFKNFALNLSTRELSKKGFRVKLHGQPIEVLALLVVRPGQMVTREALKQALWPKDTFVDFEHSLNSTINKLREALGDDPDAPRFIETIPRLGYRFIARLAEEMTAPGASGSTNTSTVQSQSERIGDGIITAERAGNEPAVPARALTRLRIPVETRIRLAVLPFTNVSDEPRNDLTNGLSTQLIVQLGHVYKDLSVIGPVSSLYFSGDIHSLPTIAKELEADYLLVGNVWRVPPRLRFFAQLIRAADQCCVWSESYTREDADILAGLDLITRDISRGLL